MVWEVYAEEIISKRRLKKSKAKECEVGVEEGEKNRSTIQEVSVPSSLYSQNDKGRDLEGTKSSKK